MSRKRSLSILTLLYIWNIFFQAESLYNSTLKSIESSYPNEKQEDIDESLYSRQLYVIGKDAMNKMSKADILVTGMSGLGAEICKNIILAGVQSLSIHDDTPTSNEDLCSNFCSNESCLNSTRSTSSYEFLKELNPYVKVNVISGSFPIEKVEKGDFDVVCCVDDTLSHQIKINESCRKSGTKFIGTSVRGVFSMLFCDFGNSFTVQDADGKEERQYTVSGFDFSDEMRLFLHEDHPDLHAGDTIRYRMHGNEAGDLNTSTAHPPFADFHIVQRHNASAFIIENITDVSQHMLFENGNIQKLKKPIDISFQPLRTAMFPPIFKTLVIPTSYSKNSEKVSTTIHTCFLILDEFKRKFNRMPMRGSKRDADAFIKILRLHPLAVAAELDEDIAAVFARTAAGSMSPMSCFIGGIVAQEILKGCTGLFMPIQQFLFFHCMEILPDKLPSSKDCAPVGDRYDGQRAIIGNDLQQELMRKRCLLVGAGAIGCELLKNFALMGVGCRSNQQNMNENQQSKDESDGRGIVVTDMDTIEKSNLSRQFLFREKDIGKSKSETAVESSRKINKNIVTTAWIKKVGPDSAKFFERHVWKNIDIAINALDNLDARLFVDSQCVKFNKPLLDSGTHGVKGSTQVIIPGLSESYGSSSDPEDHEIPLCTIKHFPTEISHTIHWARDVFESLFTIQPQLLLNILEAARDEKSESDFIGETMSREDLSIAAAVDCIEEDLPTDGMDFAKCLQWAKRQFNALFQDNVHDLITQHPSQSVDEDGQYFWQNGRRQPRALVLNSSNRMHREFIWWAAFLRANIYQVRIPSTLSELHSFDKENSLEKQSEAHSSWQHNENDLNMEKKLRKALSTATTWRKSGRPLPQPLSFEKDGGTNGHIDFICSASNLRAMSYNIPTADKLRTKQIAGKIVPAIATTTAAVAGLVCIELMKIVIQSSSKKKKKTLSPFRNAFLDLSQPFFSFSEPAEVERILWGRGDDSEKWFTLWDKINIDVPLNMTLKEVLKIITTKFEVKSVSLYVQDAIIYASFMYPEGKYDEKDENFISILVNQNITVEVGDSVDVTVVADDENGLDLNFPTVRITFVEEEVKRKARSFWKKVQSMRNQSGSAGK